MPFYIQKEARYFFVDKKGQTILSYCISATKAFAVKVWRIPSFLRLKKCKSSTLSYQINNRLPFLMEIKEFTNGFYSYQFHFKVLRFSKFQSRELFKLDIKNFRNCLGHFATGVTIITSETEAETHGFTANSFTSVSLDPMLVLVSVDRKTKALNVLKDNNFIVNILKEDQQDAAMHFAGRTMEKMPFQWEAGILGNRIKDSLAYIECEPWRSYDGGDHVLFLGEVKNFEYSGGNPLAYYCGKFSEVLTK
ncbi:flavin reductase (DIM6/NTAB) family NADH-FMN oxidoreductase RutF [Pseudogracilibacillus auburnensis]|uniref:Flavin reductase (DIM6/NTAB) family NADH-FMN oxidoreductase RutF n=1 Tax=Pseudogracilibacillus auburnensis TaxID=1494959 RepID=A0A2V3W0Y3_9BACI|nr:flavin reductase (DIM6/NTAB) family NADH-FMN oxidoreductase RutF [Pseudogracilibacillus auburnensis]